MTLKKRLGFIFGALAVVVGIASAAYACAVLTTLELNRSKARPGATITATGGNYRQSTETAPVTDVEIRLDSRTGRLLATATPTPDRRIEATFDVPKVKAGWHTVLATQYNASTGAPVAGTPGRAQLKIRRTSSGAMVPVAWRPYSGSTDVAPATLPISQSTSNVLLLVALLGLGGAGVAAASRKKNGGATARA